MNETNNKEIFDKFIECLNEVNSHLRKKDEIEDRILFDDINHHIILNDKYKHDNYNKLEKFRINILLVYYQLYWFHRKALDFLNNN